MSDPDTQSRVLKVLASVVPGAKLETLNPEVNFRDQFEFDSADFLIFARRLQEEFAIHLSEMEYPRLSNLQGCLRVVSASPRAAKP